VIKQTESVKVKLKIYIGLIFLLLSVSMSAQTKKDEAKLAKEALGFFDARQ
jgi:hypothetical protein